MATGYIARDGSYIILIRDGNIWKLSIEISSLLFDREYRYKFSGIMKLDLSCLEQVNSH